MVSQPLDEDHQRDDRSAARYAHHMKAGSLRLLRAVEVARGKHEPAPAQRPRFKIVPAVPKPGQGLGYRIIHSVAQAYGMTIDEFVSARRTRRHACARYVAAKILREQRRADGTYRYSYPQIGKMLGGRDHTTIIYGMDVFDTYLRNFPMMARVYNDLRHSFAQ